MRVFGTVKPVGPGSLGAVEEQLQLSPLAAPLVRQEFLCDHVHQSYFSPVQQGGAKERSAWATEQSLRVFHEMNC